MSIDGYGECEQAAFGVSAVLALLLSTLRGALSWTARKHDVRRSGDSGEY